MKIRIILSVLIVFIAHFLIAKDTLRIYYDKDGAQTADKSSAIHYSKIFRDSNNTWAVRDYYMSNKVRMTGAFTSKDLRSRQGYFAYYFESGQKEYEGEYVEDKKEGVWQYWYENGKKHMEGKMLNNKKEGLWTYWYENGSKKSEGKIVKDKKEGQWVYCHENGVKSSQGRYHLGRSEDDWVYWREDSRKKSEGKFFNGLKTGVWAYWNEKGELELEEKVHAGMLYYITYYYGNGVKKAEGYVSDNKKGSEWIYRNIDDKIYLKGYYSNGLQNGEWLRYFDNGESMTIYYENGIFKGKQFGQVVRKE